MIKVLMDENLSEQFAEGLNKMQSPLENRIEVTSMGKEFSRGMKDEDWIPEWGSKSGIFVTQDLNIHRTRQQAQLLSRNDVGAFFLKVPKSYKYWDRVSLIVNKWQEIVALIQNQNRPFAFEITPRRIMRLRLPN